MTVKKRILLCLLLIWCIMILSIGSSFAKYQTKTSGDYFINVRKPGTFLVTETEDENLKNWQIQADGSCRTGIKVSNQETTDGPFFESDLYYTFKIACTGSTGDFSLITHNAQGIERVYEGTKTVWSEDTLQYQQMGPGCYWSFLDIAGDEVIWMLEGGKVSMNEYIIQMQGTSTPELMEIIITEAVTKE